MDSTLMFSNFFMFMLGWILLASAWSAALAAGYITVFQILLLIGGGLILFYSGGMFVEATRR